MMLRRLVNVCFGVYSPLFLPLQGVLAPFGGILQLPVRQHARTSLPRRAQPPPDEVRGIVVEPLQLLVGESMRPGAAANRSSTWAPRTCFQRHPLSTTRRNGPKATHHRLGM